MLIIIQVFKVIWLKLTNHLEMLLADSYIPTYIFCDLIGPKLCISGWNLSIYNW